MGQALYLVAKAERSLRIPTVTVAVKKPDADENDNDTKVAILSGATAGAVSQLAAKKVVGDAVGAGGRYVWARRGKLKALRRVVRR